MNIEFRRSFEKDFEKLPSSLKISVGKIIEDIVSKKKLTELSSCKKLTGYKTAYRIKTGSYRIGFFFENDTVELVRVLNRKDIYKYFP